MNEELLAKSFFNKLVTSYKFTQILIMLQPMKNTTTVMRSIAIFWSLLCLLVILLFLLEELLTVLQSIKLVMLIRRKGMRSITTKLAVRM